MNRMLVALLITCTTGCVLRGEYRGVAYVVDGTMVAAGAGLLAAPEPDQWAHDSSTGDDSGAAGSIVVAPLMFMHEVGVGLIVAGVVAALVNYRANVDYVTPAEADAHAATFAAADLPPLPSPPGAHPDAMRMAKQARRAALAGQCGSVRLLAPKVDALDAGYYASVFSADPPIRACL